MEEATTKLVILVIVNEHFQGPVLTETQSNSGEIECIEETEKMDGMDGSESEFSQSINQGKVKIG